MPCCPVSSTVCLLTRLPIRARSQWHRPGALPHSRRPGHVPTMRERSLRWGRLTQPSAWREGGSSTRCALAGCSRPSGSTSSLCTGTGGRYRHRSPSNRTNSVPSRIPTIVPRYPSRGEPHVIRTREPTAIRPGSVTYCQRYRARSRRALLLCQLDQPSGFRAAAILPRRGRAAVPSFLGSCYSLLRVRSLVLRKDICGTIQAFADGRPRLREVY